MMYYGTSYRVRNTAIKHEHDVGEASLGTVALELSQAHSGALRHGWRQYCQEKNKKEYVIHCCGEQLTHNTGIEPQLNYVAKLSVRSLLY